MTLLQYWVIVPIIGKIPVLHSWYFFLFVVVTLIIAGSGYVVNDIVDRDIDKVNKPDKTYIPGFISVKGAWFYYYLVIGTGLLLSIFIAIQTGNEENLWIYPLAVWLLYMYAKKWKSSILTGNIIVSLFVAFIWGILFYVQFSNESALSENNTLLSWVDKVLWELCWVYFTFAFLINLSREIVKDVEDAEGDKILGINTLPIYWGLQKTKVLVLVMIVLLSAGICTWLFVSDIGFTFQIRMYYLVFVVSPLLGVMTKLFGGKHKNDFSYISKVLKWVMLFALLGILLIGNTLEL